jgi:hypothetical protein
MRFERPFCFPDISPLGELALLEKGTVSMSSKADMAATNKLVRSQIARRPLDTSLLDIRVMHGTCYLRGVVRLARGYMHLDLNKEMEIISTMLRQKAGIRDVVWEVTQRT